MAPLHSHPRARRHPFPNLPTCTVMTESILSLEPDRSLMPGSGGSPLLVSTSRLFLEEELLFFSARFIASCVSVSGQIKTGDWMKTSATE